MQQPKISIQTPCPKTWAELIGDDRKRFCGQCQKHVHNGEAMTRQEAESLVQESQGKVCMRLTADDTGQVLYKDTPKKPRSLVQRAGLAIAAGGLVAACSTGPKQPAAPDVPPVEVAQPGQEPGTAQASPPEILGDVLVEPEEEEAAAAADPPEHRRLLGLVQLTPFEEIEGQGGTDEKPPQDPRSISEILGRTGPAPLPKMSE